MSQLPLFEGAPQTHPPTQSRSAREASIAPSSQPQSPRTKTTRQQPRLAPSAATAQLIAAPIVIPTDRDSATRRRAAASDRPLEPAPPPAKALPQGWVDPADPAFNYLKNCRLCGWPIKHGGLDHSLCSGDCGWVVDLIWLARQQQRKRSKEPEPQAATNTDSGETETLDLFSYGIDRDTSDLDGGVA